MLGSYLYIALFLGVAILFTVSTLMIPATLRRVPRVKIVPHNPDAIKSATYECGMDTVGSSWVQFNFRYYYYALVFVVVDVLTVFLYPWALNLMSTTGSSPVSARLLSLAAVSSFILVVAVGYLYAWRKGILEWK